MTETMNTFCFTGLCFSLKNCPTMKVGNQIDNTNIEIVKTLSNVQYHEHLWFLRLIECKNH